jgi:hypothetical protein
MPKLGTGPSRSVAEIGACDPSIAESDPSLGQHAHIAYGRRGFSGTGALAADTSARTALTVLAIVLVGDIALLPWRTDQNSLAQRHAT